MAYQTGTATSYIDLLQKFKTFVTTDTSLVTANQNWSVLKETTEEDGAIYFKAPGISTAEEIFINLKAYNTSVNDIFGFQVSGATGHLPSADFDAQPNTSPNSYFLLWNNTIKYWMVANGQRAIILAKVSTYYFICYLGKIISYGSPNHFPYNVIVAGNTNSIYYAWNQERHDISNITCPGEGCNLHTPGGAWQQIRHRYSTSTFYLNDIQITPNINPYDSQFSQLGNNPDNSTNLFPKHVIYFNNNFPKNVYGELDGIYYIPGLGVSAESIITIGTQDYLIFPNVARNTRVDFSALELK